MSNEDRRLVSSLTTEESFELPMINIGDILSTLIDQDDTMSNASTESTPISPGIAEHNQLVPLGDSTPPETINTLSPLAYLRDEDQPLETEPHNREPDAEVPFSTRRVVFGAIEHDAVQLSPQTHNTVPRIYIALYDVTLFVERETIAEPISEIQDNDMVAVQTIETPTNHEPIPEDIHHTTDGHTIADTTTQNNIENEVIDLPEAVAVASPAIADFVENDNTNEQHQDEIIPDTGSVDNNNDQTNPPLNLLPASEQAPQILVSSFEAADPTRIIAATVDNSHGSIETVAHLTVPASSSRVQKRSNSSDEAERRKIEIKPGSIKRPRKSHC